MEVLNNLWESCDKMTREEKINKILDIEKLLTRLHVKSRMYKGLSKSIVEASNDSELDVAYMDTINRLEEWMSNFIYESLMTCEYERRAKEANAAIIQINNTNNYLVD